MHPVKRLPVLPVTLFFLRTPAARRVFLRRKGGRRFAFFSVKTRTFPHCRMRWRMFDLSSSLIVRLLTTLQNASKKIMPVFLNEPRPDARRFQHYPTSSFFERSSEAPQMKIQYFFNRGSLKIPGNEQIHQEAPSGRQSFFLQKRIFRGAQ